MRPPDPKAGWITHLAYLTTLLDRRDGHDMGDLTVAAAKSGAFGQTGWVTPIRVEMIGVQVLYDANMALGKRT